MTTTPPPCELTSEEMTETLTGFDEIAINKHMDLDVYNDAETKSIGIVRALVFIHRTRLGDNAPDAKKYALSMPLKDLLDYFNDEEEGTPDEPRTQSGKDD